MNRLYPNQFQLLPIFNLILQHLIITTFSLIIFNDPQSILCIYCKDIKSFNIIRSFSAFSIILYICLRCFLLVTDFPEGLLFHLPKIILIFTLFKILIYCQCFHFLLTLRQIYSPHLFFDLLDKHFDSLLHLLFFSLIYLRSHYLLPHLYYRAKHLCSYFFF